MEENTGKVNLNICFGCMRSLQGQMVCPSCHYDNSVRNNPEDTLPEGTILYGKYLVGKVLGRGGFGVTYLGYDINLQIRVAIKEYFPTGISFRSSQSYNVVASTAEVDHSAFSKGCDVFINEARILARFNSPYIVHVRDFFKEHGTAYIVMDYVPGVTLTSLAGKMDAGRLLSLSKPLMESLARLHEEGIIHRDIKPDNIMLVADRTGGEHLVLLDFGAARSYVSTNTKSMTAVVTQGFAPLEQYSSQGRMGPFTDVYALCATMYYLLTAQIPPPAPDRMIDSKQVTPLSSFPVPIPEAMGKAIMHGLALKSENRPQSMRLLQQEMEQGQPNPIPPSTPPVPAPSEKSKMKPLMIAIAVVAVLIVAIVAGSMLKNPGAAPATVSASSSLSAQGSGTEAELYQEALSLLAKKKYSEAEAAFEKLKGYEDSASKLAEVRYQIGLTYEAGKGVTKNERIAVSYYQLAADAGNADALNKLGECAYNGIGKSVDYDAAVKYFTQASDLGSIDALYNLGLCYETGNGVTQNTRIASSYYKLAADAGHKEAAKKLN